MGTKFFYALAWTLCTAVFTLLMFFTGYQTEKMATGQHLQWFGLLIPIVILYLGIKAVRDEKPGGVLTYGQGVSAGMVISTLAGAMGAVYTFIHFSFINPRFADYSIDLIRGKWTAAGMSEAQMEGAEKITRTMLAPPIQSILGFVFTLVIGLVISLVIAAILKREKPLPAPAMPPPTPPPA